MFTFSLSLIPLPFTKAFMGQSVAPSQSAVVNQDRTLLHFLLLGVILAIGVKISLALGPLLVPCPWTHTLTDSSVNADSMVVMLDGGCRCMRRAGVLRPVLVALLPSRNECIICHSRNLLNSADAHWNRSGLHHNTLYAIILYFPTDTQAGTGSRHPIANPTSCSLWMNVL